ncbi:MAG: Do family serine endopeptidase [Rhodospirillales bacterium]|nr:Do family serine endopeptidase [Rhodospirillales bacterium]
MSRVVRPDANRPGQRDAGADTVTRGRRHAVLATVLALAVGFATTAPAGAKTAPDTFADLAEQLLPSVVNISTTQVVEGNTGIEVPVLPPGSPFEEFFKEFMERGQPRQRQRRATSLGSGFVVDTSGHVVTNNHVIADADEISVILADETRLPARVVGRDPKTDIAVLKIEPTQKLRAVRFGNSDQVRVGDWVIAIGNPFGFGGTVTAGIISARGRDINAGLYDDFIQTDASINRGNSGGPMFNLAGEVVGINTAIFSPSGGSVGIGFAIPVNGAKPVIDQLIQHGQVRRGWLGVRIQGVTDEIAETLGLKGAHGALVASVMDGGPAQAANIRPGDVIIEFDGKTVDQMRGLPRLVAETEVGKTVDVKLWRENREMTVRVKVGTMEDEETKAATAPVKPEGARGAEKVAALGISVAAIDDKLRQTFGISGDVQGLVVTQVDPAGTAAAEGIKAGDVIVQVSKEKVDQPSQLMDKLNAAKTAGQRSLLVLIESDSGMRFIAIRIDRG